MKKIFIFCSALLAPLCTFANSPFSVQGYWESWNSVEEPEEIADMKVDVIHIAFGSIRGVGHSQKVVATATDEQIHRLVTSAHAAHKKVLVSLRGFNLTDSSQISDLTKATVDFVRKFRLDGIDLFVSDQVPKTSLQVAWIKSLRKKLGSDAIINYTSPAIAAIPSPVHDVLVSIHNQLTAIHLPAYNLGAGYHFEGTVDSLIRMGIPKHKILIGIFPGKDSTGHFTTLNAISSTTDFVKSHFLNGVCVWTLNRDHANYSFLGKDWVTNFLSSSFSPICFPCGTYASL